MRPIIGIVGDWNDEYINEIKEAGGDYFSIINTSPNILSFCDGILFTGGDDPAYYHFKIMDYAYKNKIPVLGICLGMQVMGLYLSKGSKYINISDLDLPIKIDHNPKLKTKKDRKKAIHKIYIKKDSYLYSLFKGNLLVNSRHNQTIINIDEKLVTAYSKDGIIEAIELIEDDYFFIGVEWHPESMNNQNQLFQLFIKNANEGGIYGKQKQ